MDIALRDLERQALAGDVDSKRVYLAAKCRLEGHYFKKICYTGRLDQWIYQICDNCLLVRSVHVDELNFPKKFVGSYRNRDCVHEIAAYRSSIRSLCWLENFGFENILKLSLAETQVTCSSCLKQTSIGYNIQTRRFKTFELLEETPDPWSYVEKLKQIRT